MLPERLSNDLCSLLEHEDRPCMAVRMQIDSQGKKRGHKFVRGMMRLRQAELSAGARYFRCPTELRWQGNDGNGRYFGCALAGLFTDG